MLHILLCYTVPPHAAAMYKITRAIYIVLLCLKAINLSMPARRAGAAQRSAHQRDAHENLGGDSAGLPISTLCLHQEQSSAIRVRLQPQWFNCRSQDSLEVTKIAAEPELRYPAARRAV